MKEPWRDHRVTDRRILRTRSMIMDAFLTVLQKKEYPEITVIDIAEQANINRSTFYAHYIDKDDLLHNMVKEKLDLLTEATSGRQKEAVEVAPAFHEPDAFFAALFEHLSDHETFYRIMLKRLNPSELHAKMQDIIKESFYIRISKLDLDQKLQVPLDILLDYISCSTQGIIVKWLEDNRIYSPHYMALQLTRLSLLGIYKAMGMKE